MARVERAPRLVVRLAAIGVTLFGVLMVVFAATEWFIARKAKVTLVYAPNADYRQDLVGNQTYSRDGFSYVIGPHGMRGAEPRPKAEGQRRIAFVGGSSVFDFRVAESWPERVGRLLRARGAAVDTMNASVPGFSTREVIPFYERRVRRHSPDVVVLYAGWNDVKRVRDSRDELSLPPYPVRRPGASDPYGFLRAPRPWRNMYALRIMVEKARLRTVFVEEGPAPAATGVAEVRTSSVVERPAWDTTVVAPVRPRRVVKGPTPAATEVAEARTSSALKGPPPPATEVAEARTISVGEWGQTPGVRYWRSNLERFVEVVRADGAAPVLVVEATLASAELSEELRKHIAYGYVRLSHDELVAVNDAMREAIREVALEKGVLLIDPREMDGRIEYFWDHVHLKEAGSARLAELVAEPLLPLVR